jgi:hypothetical protein
MTNIKYIILLIIIFIGFSLIYKLWHGPKINRYFYDIADINKPSLNRLKFLEPAKKEILDMSSQSITWYPWTESKLYKDESKKMYVIPLYGFGIWHPGLLNYPSIISYLKSIPSLKLAYILKIPPQLVLEKHRGWGYYSNDIIRCQYGISVPKNCFISVDNQKRFYDKNKWIIYDYSKIHFMANLSFDDLILLVIDIDRPTNIIKGESKERDIDGLVRMITLVKAE